MAVGETMGPIVVEGNGGRKRYGQPSQYSCLGMNAVTNQRTRTDRYSLIPKRLDHYTLTNKHTRDIELAARNRTLDACIKHLCKMESGTDFMLAGPVHSELLKRTTYHQRCDSSVYLSLSSSSSRSVSCGVPWVSAAHFQSVNTRRCGQMGLQL